MLHDRKIHVAGHRGLAGSAIIRCLVRHGCADIVTRSRDELDLADAAAVEAFYASERPDVVFLAAAHVGGILANDSFPADFVLKNLQIQTNVLTSAWRHGTRRLAFLGSSCIYPRDCPQPIGEAALLNGPLEPTNRPYAIAKIAGIEACWALNRQYGAEYFAVMPTNLYGPGDRYDPVHSHVLPALLHRFQEAAARGDTAVTAWGTGKPKREFLHSDDMAEACVMLAALDSASFRSAFPGEQPPIINAGFGSDVEIRELAAMVAAAVGYRGRIDWDTTKPDGTPRKLLDSSRLRALGWRPHIGLDDGIRLALADFRLRFAAPGN